MGQRMERHAHGSAGGAVEVKPDVIGVWTFLGEHGPSGRRFVWAQACMCYETALAMCQGEAYGLDPLFGRPADWRWTSQWEEVGDLLARAVPGGALEPADAPVLTF